MAVHTQHETLATLRKTQGHLLATTVPLPCLRALPLPVHESRAHQTAPRRGATCRSQVSLYRLFCLNSPRSKVKAPLDLTFSSC